MDTVGIIEDIKGKLDALKTAVEETGKAHAEAKKNLKAVKALLRADRKPRAATGTKRGRKPISTDVESAKTKEVKIVSRATGTAGKGATFPEGPEGAE